MSAQFIEIDGKQAVVLSADDYRVLREKAEMLDDVVAFDSAKAALDSAEDELVPADVVHDLLDGENPIRVWRKHRGLSQVALAQKIGISQAYLA
ncbi:MAG: helix-turn-helix domain-containing protein, partial [Gammaproteobacteria bacterium]